MYTLFRLSYSALWLIILPWVTAALLLKQKHRAGLAQRLGLWPEALQANVALVRALHDGSEQAACYWIHAVSVGELNAMKPLIFALLAKNNAVFLTTTTQTAHSLAQSLVQMTELSAELASGKLLCAYCPLDAPWLARDVLLRVQPKALLIAETELWPGLVLAADRLRIPVLLVNGRISPRSFQSYRRIKPLLSLILARYHRFLMQSDADAERIKTLGAPVERVSVMGNLKLVAAPVQQHALEAQWRQWLGLTLPDGHQPDCAQVQTGTIEARQLNDLSPLYPYVVVFASTHRGEEQALLGAYQALIKAMAGTKNPKIKLVWAPRHPERVAEADALLKAEGLDYVKRSDLSPIHSDNVENVPQLPSIILLDCVGELNAVFACAQVAVMGNSWGLVQQHGGKGGGQNPIEPLMAGCLPVYGPDMKNFEAISAGLAACHGAVALASVEALPDAILNALTATVQRERQLAAAKGWIETQNQSLALALAAITGL
ncbi:MAG: glycosyltransferase N-terminal domain-containing protein [Vampirovibrionales bacterium]|nr:glycosyltransferase N-terminal domain-containing protein [Vampirovibrionales bacterium]